MKKILYIFFFTTLITLWSCEDLIETAPVNIITDDVVITDAASVESVLLGIYNSLQSGNTYNNLAITTPGVLSDELIHSGSFPTVAEMDRNQVLPSNVTAQGTWQSYYNGILVSNVLLERIGVVTMDEDLRDQYIGEARFLRALFHFNLTNLWGAIPLATTSDLATLSTIPRTSQEDIYAFVEAELTAAATLLSGVDQGNKVRVNEWGVKALHARVKLYAGDRSGAGALANDVITNGGYSLEADYGDVFDGGSSETILEVFSSVNDQNGIAFQFRTSGRYEYAPSAQLIAAFEPGDERAVMVENPGGAKPEAAKYLDVGTGTDRTIVLRLAEMYLIRAEANIGNAQADNDLNEIRNRAGLTDKASITLDDIMEERFVELCYEGHRWFDLIRTNRVDAVMSVINPTTWVSTASLLPIPLREIQQNPNLTQNPGY